MVDFIPTVSGHYFENERLVLETLDPDEQSDLVSVDESLKRKGDLLTDEQKEKLILRNKQ